MKSFIKLFGDYLKAKKHIDKLINQLNEHIHDYVDEIRRINKWRNYVESEEFLNDVVERINKKQVERK